MSEEVMWNDSGMFVLNGVVPHVLNGCRRAMPLDGPKKKHAFVKLLVPDCVVKALLERPGLPPTRTIHARRSVLRGLAAEGCRHHR